MTYATIQEVNTSIMFSNFSNEQLDSITSAVQYARAQLRAVKIRSFTRGDTVKFHSTKRGVTVTGTVTKVAIKYVTVRDGVTLWKVPANMLEAA
jgi:LysM repeat protein